MSNGAYVYMDVSRKQEFIFKQNELKSSLFRSFIIKSLTEDLSNDEDLRDIPKLGYKTLNQFLAEKGWEHRFVFSGGGNSIVYFSQKADALSFMRMYTVEVLKQFPELELYMSLADEVPGNNHKDLREQLYRKADRLKDQRAGQFRRWSYGIEKIDAAGMPVRWQTEEEKAERREQEVIVQGRLMRRLERASAEGEHFIVTKQLQDYRKKRDGHDIGKSYIGIIAIDGNQMGEIVKQVDTFDDLWEFGRWIERVYYQAVCEALKAVGDPELRVTPVVMAGDDICLITNAEYALELAQNIVQSIKELSQSPYYAEPEKRTGATISPLLANRLAELGLTHLSACAGVAVTKITYPFYEAVKAAEDSCKQAKSAIHEKWEGEGQAPMPSLLDWRIVLGQIDPTEQYEHMVGRMNITEHFHIKPLQIAGPSEEKWFLTFAEFNELSERLIMALGLFEQQTGKGDPLAKGTVSHAKLEEVRRTAYNGPDAYRQLFRNDSTGQLRWLNECVQEIFEEWEGRLRGEFESDAPIVRDVEGHSVTYILHDILEVLPYMRSYWLARSSGKGGDDHAIS